jgi:two-component system, OmpR family, sensor kinase
MRIGAKLLTTYLILIALMGMLAGLVLPRAVQFSMIREEKARLQLMVSRQASTLGARLSRGIRSRNPADSVAARVALNNIAELLVDETLMIVDDRGVIIGSSRPGLDGQSLALVEQNSEDFIVVRAPLQMDIPQLSGFSVAMIRDVSEIEVTASRITRRLSLVIIPSILVALLIAGWVSRGMVKRLRATGAAVQALAEGDLTHRVPEQGNDEITDLARNINYMAGRIGVLVDGLRRSEQARKELLVICSHELRTPLTSIGGFAEALRDRVVQGDERRQRYYEIIAAEAARLTRLIKDMFDMAKLEAGQIELRLQAMAVAPWLVEFAEGFQPVAAEHGCPLELEITPEAERARIYGDRDQLDRVLTNLCSNAVRYAPTGEPVLIRARTDGEDLLLEVSDKGPGIPLEEQDRVFERFFQGSSKSPDHKGAGLGLAIVKSLVEGHGGQVGFQSTPGQGATFWVRLRQVAT